MPDGLTLSGTWLSASVVDLLLASSVVTTRWISLAWLAVATDARTAIKLNVLKSMAPLFFRCGAIACMGGRRGRERGNFPVCRQDAGGADGIAGCPGSHFAAYHGV